MADQATPLGRAPVRALIVEQVGPAVWKLVPWGATCSRLPIIDCRPGAFDAIAKSAIVFSRRHGLPIGIRSTGCAARSYRRPDEWHETRRRPADQRRSLDDILGTHPGWDGDGGRAA